MVQRVSKSVNPLITTKDQEEGEEITKEEDFDPRKPPPFRLSDIRAAIPKHCWVKNPWKSMSYVVRDISVAIALAATASFFNSWMVWPLYWVAQGTIFWAFFVLGHDWYCGTVISRFFRI